MNKEKKKKKRLKYFFFLFISFSINHLFGKALFSALSLNQFTPTGNDITDGLIQSIFITLLIYGLSWAYLSNRARKRQKKKLAKKTLKAAKKIEKKNPKARRNK